MIKNKSKGKLDKLSSWLTKNKIEQLIRFSAPISEAEIKKAESVLKEKLPPSYKEFVATCGAFVIPGELTGNGYMNDSALYAPNEIAEQTLKYRKLIAKSKDENSKKILNDGLLFCSHPRNERFFLFVLSGTNKKGEIRSRFYDYQDPANNDPWFEGDGNFDSTIDELVKTVRKNALKENKS